MPAIADEAVIIGSAYQTAMRPKETRGSAAVPLSFVLPQPERRVWGTPVQARPEPDAPPNFARGTHAGGRKPALCSHRACRMARRGWLRGSDRTVTAVLITGGTGFVGGHLRPSLREREVVLLGRSEPALRENERWRHLDLSERVEREDLSGADVLCHLAYATQAGTANVGHNERLLRAVNDSPDIRRVVLLSTTSVYGAGATEGVLDEDSPCNPSGEYGNTKLECEMLWRDGLRCDCDLIVLRPSEIVGPGGRGLLPVVHDALERPLVGAVKRAVLYHRRLHYVAVANVVAAIRFALERPRSEAGRRELYVVSDDHQPENESYAAMQDAVRKLAGRRPLRGAALPRPLLRIVGDVVGRPLSSGYVYSSCRLRDAGFVGAPLIEEVRRLVRSVGGPAGPATRV